MSESRASIRPVIDVAGSVPNLASGFSAMSRSLTRIFIAIACASASFFGFSIPVAVRICHDWYRWMMSRSKASWSMRRSSGRTGSISPMLSPSRSSMLAKRITGGTPVPCVECET